MDLEKKSFIELKEFINKNPKDSLARYNLGLMAQTIGLIEEAKEYYKQAIKDDNKNWQALFNLYILYIKDKNYNEALSLINYVLVLKKKLSASSSG